VHDPLARRVRTVKRIGLLFALTCLFAIAPAHSVGQGAAPVHLVVGYQPYYSGAWSALVVKEQQLWKKYLPPGSTVDWEVGLQGSIITNNMLAGKYQMGYVGDMPGIVATTKRNVADLRILSVTSFNNQQCDLFVVRPDAPQFKTAQEAVKWMDGKRVAVPKGSCTDRFAQAVFARENVKPAQYLNQSIEVIATNLRAGNLDAAVIWDPNVAHVGQIVGNKSARLVSTGADWDEHDSGVIIVSKDFLDSNPRAVIGMLKADIEAQQFILSNYPKNACALASYAVTDTTGFTQREMWFALYGRLPVGDAAAQARAIRWGGHLVFDRPVRAFFASASNFLQQANIINEPMPADAIVDGPLREAMRELKVRAPLGQTQTHNVDEYPCG
jgi:NitT/TauT family transport system substrate-binding protein